jgi:hypothetical protein
MTKGKDSNGDSFRRPKQGTQIGNVADWGSVNAEKLVKLIETASKKGGAIRFGYTRDGGAYALGVYAGTNYFTDFIRPTEDLDQYLTELTESFNDYDGSTESQPSSSGSKRR